MFKVLLTHLINEVFFNPRASDEDYVRSTGLVVNGDSIPSIADGDEWSAIYNVYLPGAAVTNSDVIYAWLSSANPQPDGLIFSFTAGLNSVDTTGEYYPVKVQIINRSGVAYQPGTGSNIMIRVLQIRQSLP